MQMRVKINSAENGHVPYIRADCPRVKTQATTRFKISICTRHKTYLGIIKTYLGIIKSCQNKIYFERT